MRDKKMWIMLLVLVLLVGSSFYLILRTDEGALSPDDTPKTMENSTSTETPVLSTPTATPTRQEQPTPVETSLPKPYTECAPPCWRGIVPGLTSAAEANEILTNCPDIVIDTFVERQDGVTFWIWQFTNQIADSSRLWGPSTIEAENGVIKRIDLSFTPEIPLSEIINQFGVPEKMVAYMLRWGNEVRCQARLYYPEKGLDFTLWLNLPNADKQLFIEPSSGVYNGVYFSPRSWDELKVSKELVGLEYIDFVYEWTGFGPIEIDPALLLGK